MLLCHSFLFVLFFSGVSERDVLSPAGTVCRDNAHGAVLGASLASASLSQWDWIPLVLSAVPVARESGLW